MKRKILAIFLSILVFFTSVLTPSTYAALQSLPVPQPPIDRESPDTDLFTGNAAYAYPIKVPKGTNDLTPEVAISYNSSSAKTSGQMGMGWQVNRDYVERDVKFTPASTLDDSFKLHFKGKVYDLVYVESEDAYHTKIESNLRIKNIGSGGSNTYSVYWEVTEKSGTKYRFGYQNQSELVCNGRSFVKQWDLDQVTDTHNNTISYNYTESNGISYLDTIKYNTDQSREIAFTYTSVPDGRKLYIQGCSTQETSKLTNIQVKANSSVVRGYTLDYTTNASSMQLLNSITETGTSSSSALPATTFDYHPQIPSFQETDEKWLNNQQMDYTDLDQDETTLMDVNGDTLPDIVRTYGDSTITWKVGINTGSTWNSLTDWMTSNPFDAGLDDSYVRLMDVTGDSLPDIVRAASSGDWRVYRNTGTSWSTTSESWGIPSVHSSVNLSSSNIQLIDVNGDNLPDVIRGLMNGGQRQWEVYKNTGSSWSNSAEVWSYGGIPDDVGEDDVQIVDVNGDGLVDIIKTTYSGTNATWSVYKNTGSSWSTSAETWINNANIDAHLEKNNVTVADVNGDGLNDIIKIIDQGSNDKWDVLLNKGNSWSTSWQTWVIGVDADVEGEDNVVLSDVNGDAIPDIVKSSLNSGGNVTWQVWKNNGEAPDLLSSVKTSQGGVIGFDYKASGQFDNTGIDSKSDLPFSMWVVDKMINNNGLPGSQNTNDITTYNYQDGLYDWNTREFRGFAVVDTIEPDTSRKKYVFHQWEALQGLPAEIQTRDSSQNPYAETESTWDYYSNNGVYTVNLGGEKEYTYDGTASNPKIREVQYEYDNYGNITKKSELGDTSVSGDERFTYNEYVYNPSSWIVDKLSHTAIKGSNNTTTVSEKWQYYDSDPLASASASAPAASKFGDGRDGNITISSNTTESPIDSAVTALSGVKTATVSAGRGFAPNQIVLFHQTQGSNAGQWEYARVESYNGTTLKLTANLTNTYSSSGSNRAQVRVLPQYNDVTVNSGVSWTAKAWNGSTGGIMAFLANGTVTINGTITSTGKGFRGGTSAYTDRGTQGEGISGAGGYVSFSPNENGGGAGQDYENQSGAGGGHESTGGHGQRNGGSYPNIPQGGVSAGTADLTTMVFGGGGGSTGVGGGHGGVGPSGGNGGGIVWITGATVSVDSSASIVSNGTSGTALYETASGGGAGGAILIKTQTGSLGTTRINAVGGAGASGTSRTSGAGSAGRVRVQYETSLSGTTNPTASTNQSTIPSVPAGVLTWSGTNTNLTKGDLTKEIKWLSGGTNPQTNYEYDSYGNLTESIDPNNNQTTYTYNINDSTRTYPERITNAKGQQTNFTYDLGTGNILTKTDANNLTVTYTYDAFNRILKEIKPYDSSTYPTKRYTYFNDGVAPEGTLVATREVSGTTNTLDMYTLVDGFGRKAQTRRSAENAANQIVQDTFYDSTGEVKKESVPYLASSSAALVDITPTPPPATKFGDGSDNDLAIAGNVTERPIDSSVIASSSASTATVGSGLGFEPNDIVLFHQSQGTNAGNWEFARVASYSGTFLTLTAGLTNTYNSSGNNHAQVRVVPQYDNVNIYSGGTYSPKAWNGSTGGILAFFAKGTVTVDGIISGVSRGFRGGNGYYSPFQNGGQSDTFSGEGTAGPSAENVCTANGNAGGCGNNWNTSVHATGGGGGGNAFSGSNGTSYGTGGGIGGNASGSADLSTMVFGGGGGGGGAAPDGGGQNGGTGGIGGAIVFIVGASITNSGSITTSGANGLSGGDVNAGDGGNGAGGSILLRTQTINSASGSITSTGGQHGNGGNGSVGRIRIEYENSVSGIATPSASTAQGAIPTIAAGTVPAEPGAYGVYQAPDPEAKTTEYTYDTLGRVTMVKSPDGEFRTTAYDHWKETDIDENGHIKRRYLNAYEKISKVEEVINFSTHATNYLYNTLDQLTQTIDAASNSGTMTYDTLGRKVSQTDPDMGTWTYAYDAADNLTSSTDARDISVGRTYDELNRLTTVNYPNDTDLGFTYDVNKIGTLSIATDSAGTVSYTYDNRLRKTAETRVIGGVSKTTTFSYDSADRMTNQTNPDSTQSNYTFNNQGEIETLGGVLDDIDYNALGKITEKEFDNGLTTQYTYNTDDFRLNRIQTGSLQDLSYTYDSVGNITSIEDDVSDKTKLFSYDDLDRLSTASESGGFNFAYEYNPIGNLTKFTSADAEINYTYGEGSAGPHAMTGVVRTASSSGTVSTNIAPAGTGYRWSQNTSSTSNSNRVAATGINDEVMNVDVELNGGSDDNANAWEAAGVTWAASQSAITKVEYTNGTWVAAEDGNGVFTQNFKLQFTTDGTTWTDSGWTSSPAYAHDNSSAGGATYTFTGNADNIKGARVVGQVRTSGAASWHAHAYELKVFQGASTETNISATGTGYRWSQNTSANSNSNRVAATGMNDSNEAVDVDLNNGSDDNENAWEAAGITWVASQSAVTKVEYINGTWNGDNNGAFTANFKLQFSTDGTTWTDSGWSVSPAYDHDSSAVSGKKYTFTGSPVTIRGARVVGQVRTGGANSWHAFAREIKVFTESEEEEEYVSDLMIYGDSLASGWTDASYNTSVTATSSAYQGTTALAATLNANGGLDFQSDAGISTEGYTAVRFALRASTSGQQYEVYADSTYGEPLAAPVSLAGYGGQPTTGGWTVYTIPLADLNAVGVTLKDIVIHDLTESSQPVLYVDSVALVGQGQPDAPFEGELTYDANGNMLAKGNQCYEYNQANQMSKVKDCNSNQTIAEYVYDYKGQRMVKKNYSNGTLANTVISWSNSFETKAIVGGATETTNYYFANNELVAKKDNAGNKVYFHNDHLGSNSITTNQAGAQVEQVTYDPWGQVLGAATQSKFLYTGQEHDDETGLHYYDARYYDAELRRFTQPDPLVQDVYDPQSLNRYSYARNNPLRYTDPSGHAWWDSVVNAAKSVVKSVQSFFSPPKAPPVYSTLPASAIPYRGPINTRSTNSSSSGGGSSGNNTTNNTGSINTPTSNGDPFINAVRERGHVDIGGAAGYGGISLGGGMKFDRKGGTQYVSGSSGFETGGKGISALRPGKAGVGFGAHAILSTDPVQEHTMGYNVTGSFILAVQFSIDPKDLTNIQMTGVGIGCCSIEVGGEWTGKAPNPTDRVPSEYANFRSKSLGDIYK